MVSQGQDQVKAPVAGDRREAQWHNLPIRTTLPIWTKLTLIRIIFPKK